MHKTSGNNLVQDLFPGMAEGRMAQIMPQGNGLSQVFVETQGPGYGAGNLRDFQSMSEAGPVMIPGRS
jgi:hypothetical protein